MAMCPKCQKPVADNVGVCPACGQVMPAKSSGTLDAAQHYDAAPNVADDEQSPSPEPPLATVTGGAPELGGTLDAPELFKFAGGEDSVPEQLPSSPVTGQASEGSPNVTVPGEGQGTSAQTVQEIGSDGVPSDMQKTLQFEPTVAGGVEGTLEYDGEDLASIQGNKSVSGGSGTGGSGTAGRLQRLWKGAVGSSQNPMRTLKGADALASDSVFAKVARRVLVTDPTIDVAESAPSLTASQSSRRARVKECIEAACTGAESAKADYDLTGFLGQGGMGVVLEAHQRAIGRKVALKMIQPSVGSSAGDTNAQKKKFFYEAQITGKLDHPNIVPIYELGISNDVLFYSMKKIDGREWKDIIQANSRNENLDILMKVSDAIAFAHQREVIHRDLKPENVMIGAFGEVLVTDWGCAIDLANNESFSCAGSPPWMAPEMADHNVKLIGPRSDIYLLGAMLYQLIAGYPPHPGQTIFECVAAAQKNIIIPLGIQDPLLDIAMKAMEKHPDDRYQTVEEFQDDIRVYRRNVESITLTDRSEALMTQAVATKDYERFSRTMFGFQDAIDLWPENTRAKAGLTRSRLAYGECAFAKNDFDLCLSILDRSVPAENELFVKAEKAKREAELRVARYKTMRRTFAASVLGLLVVLSGVSVVALWQRQIAIKAKEDAIGAEKTAVIAKDEAIAAKNDAITARNEETIAKNAAIEAQKLEAAARLQATMDANAARRANFNAERESKKEQLAAIRASKEAWLARVQTVKADAATVEAIEQGAKVEIKSVESRLALALSQVAQRDIATAVRGLESITNTTPEGYPALFAVRGKLPKLNNWAANRISLLSNQDLVLKDAMGDGTVNAVAFAQAANRGVVATRVPSADGKSASGLLNIVELREKKPMVTRSLVIPAPATAITISPNGDEIVYALESASDDFTLFRQKLSDNAAPERVVDADGTTGEANQRAIAAAAELQSMVSSNDKLLTGINRGMWVWTRSEGDWRQSAPTQIPEIRGRLRSLQLMDATRALALVDFNGALLMHNIDLQAGKAQQIALAPTSDSSFAKTSQAVSAVAYANGKLVIGTQAGKLFTTAMQPTEIAVTSELEEILPQQHQSTVRKIHAHADGTLLTTAIEPVVYVWRTSAEQAGGWQLATSLTGTSGNVSGMDFMISSNLVLGVDETGTAVVWDVERQKQRKQLTRRDASGEAFDYASPVVQVIVDDKNKRAVSIHTDGLLDSWDLSTGKTLEQSQVPEQFSFIGHTPGSSFVDMAIDPRAGVLVTCASLQKSAAEQQEQAAADSQNAEQDVKLLTTFEFCKWDLNTRKMLDRWQVESEKSQLVSLLADAKYILYAEDNATLVREANGNMQNHFTSEKLGSYFAVAHPKQTNLAMVVKRSGAVRMYDSSVSDGGWNNDSYRLEYKDARNAATLSFGEDSPLDGIWNPSGNRFYMVWESGRITEYAWENNQLAVKRDLGEMELAKLDIALQGEVPVSTESKKKPASIRLTSRWQLDLKVREATNENALHMLVRIPGAAGKMQAAKVTFPTDDGTVQAEKVQYASAYRLYLTDTATPRMSAELLTRLPLNARAVVGVRTFGDSAFMAAGDGTVYQVNGDQLVATFGRPAVIAASGDASANKIVILQEGGGLWRVSYADQKWDWTPLQAAPAGAKAVTTSPDGEQLLISSVASDGSKSISLANPTSGEVTETISQVLVSRWRADGNLAMVMADGQVQLRNRDGNKRLVAEIENAVAVQDIHFFVEPWSDPAQAAHHWLMVQSNSSSDDAESETRIEFLALDAENDQAADRAKQPERRTATLGRGVSLIACSPKEGIFVAGEAGSVSVHFASPSLAQYGESPLFNLEGHAGAELTSIVFSPDGQTLITTDSNNRLFGWMSNDSLGGIEDPNTLAAEPVE